MLTKLKYTGASALIAILLYANYNLVTDMFFNSEYDERLNIKDVVIPTNEEIKELVVDAFPGDKIDIKDDNQNKSKHLILINGNLEGYAYTVIENIPCSVCSNVNFLLIADKHNYIIDFVLLRNNIEKSEMIPNENYYNYLKIFKGKNISKIYYNTDLFDLSFENHSYFILQSLTKLKIGL